MRNALYYILSIITGSAWLLYTLILCGKGGMELYTSINYLILFSASMLITFYLKQGWKKTFYMINYPIIFSGLVGFAIGMNNLNRSLLNIGLLFIFNIMPIVIVYCGTKLGDRLRRRAVG